MRFCTKRHTRQ